MTQSKYKYRTTVLVLVFCQAVAGCSLGSKDGNNDSPSTPGASGNRAPAISGTPATLVAVGQAYSFRPVATDPDGQALSFRISGRPAWASFNNATGELSGTPAASDAGTYPGILITATDGSASTALPAFDITVARQLATGSATLSWRAPTRNEDGTLLTNLAGYRVRYGMSTSALNQMVTIGNAGTTTVTIPNLSTGTWFFTLSSFTNVGVESAQTAPVSKTIS